MKRRSVVYTQRSRADLDRILVWLAELVSPVAALAVTERLVDFTDRLDLAAERGQLREDLRPNLRIVAFERATIAFAVTEAEVFILRIFYGGEDWETALKQEDAGS